jgi:hypothetical protein
MCISGVVGGHIPWLVVGLQVLCGDDWWQSLVTIE